MEKKEEGLLSDVLENVLVRHRKSTGYYGPQRHARLVAWGETVNSYKVWLGTIEGGLDILAVKKKEKIIEWFLKDAGIIGKEIQFRAGGDEQGQAFFAVSPLKLRYSEIMKWAEKKAREVTVENIVSLNIDEETIEYLKNRPIMKEKQKKKKVRKS